MVSLQTVGVNLSRLDSLDTLVNLGNGCCELFKTIEHGAPLVRVCIHDINVDLSTNYIKNTTIR